MHNHPFGDRHLIVRLIVLTIFMALMWNSARAAEQFGARGVGTTTCADFSQLYKDDPSETALVFGSWAQGFLSGWNYVTSVQGVMRDLGAKSAKEQIAYMLEYCRSHPQDVVYKAISQFYGGMSRSLLNLAV